MTSPNRLGRRDAPSRGGRRLSLAKCGLRPRRWDRWPIDRTLTPESNATEGIRLILPRRLTPPQDFAPRYVEDRWPIRTGGMYMRSNITVRLGRTGWSGWSERV